MFGNELNRIFTEGGAHDAIIIGHGDYRLDPVTKDPTVDRIIQLTPVLSELAELPGVALSVSLSLSVSLCLSLFLCLCLSLRISHSLLYLSLLSLHSVSLSLPSIYLFLPSIYLFLPSIYLFHPSIYLSLFLFPLSLFLSLSIYLSTNKKFLAAVGGGSFFVGHPLLHI
jgi:hypothetical protein